MSERIVILGAGGHGRVVLETARAAGLDVVGVLDARADQLGPEVLGVPVLGGDDRLERATEEGATHYLLGVGHLGDASIRRRLVAAAQAAGLQPAVAVHPTAYVSPSAKLAPGTVVLPHAVVHTQARLGEHVIVNTAAIVEHDAQLEAHVHIATAAALAGDVRVGPDTLIGARAVVRQGIRIGAGCVIGAGAVVVKDVADRATVTGNPARPWHAR
jgi:sugar O-acyltransferase (sialic acid O-acetyltransferase NeuD family)